MELRSTRMLIAGLATALMALLVGAPAAMAAEGVGILGHVTDKTITLLFFGVIVLFPITITVLSIVQGKLEARKERRRYDLERFS